MLSGPVISYPVAHTNVAEVNLPFEFKLYDRAIVAFNGSHITESKKHELLY
jgi:hypothetical protein